MTARELLSSLNKKGISVWAENGNLRFRGPKSAITSEIRSKLALAKSEILELLKVQEKEFPIIQHQSEDAEKPFPLTDLQGAYYVGRSEVYAHGGTSCHGYFELELPKLDVIRLTHCWNKLVKRHSMLRAVFLPNATQKILTDVPYYEIKEHDISILNKIDKKEKLQIIRDKMSHQHFDAEKWPLFDIEVSKDELHSILHVSIDLSIADYLSINILMKELGILYDDDNVILKQLEIDFHDIVIAENKINKHKNWERDRIYWKSRFDSFPDAPLLPIINKEEQQSRFVRRHIVLDAAKKESISRYAIKRSMNIGGALLAAYADIIGRWSTSSRFALNLTVLNRFPWHDDVMSLVGDFTSVNILEVERKKNETFTEFARGLQARLWEDLDHRLFSGVKVLRELSRERGTTVLMPVVFTNTVGVGTDQDSRSFFTKGRMIHGISQTPQVWLDCQVMEAGGELHVQWDSLEDIFPAGVLDNMFSAFCEKIYMLAEQDDAWDMPTSIPLPENQTQSRVLANATAKGYQYENLYTSFERQAFLTPENLAVISDEKCLTYHELYLFAGGVCQQLLEEGIKPEENVAILLEKGWKQPVAVLGALAAGATYVPLDPTWPQNRLALILKEANIRFILSEVSQADSYSKLGNFILIPVDTELKVPPIGKPVSPEKTAYIIYTSGSTGTPKGVVISHASASNTIQDINQRFEVTEHDRILAVSRLSFDLSVFDIFGPLSRGGAVIIPRQDSIADPAGWVDAIKRFGGTLWNSVPALFEMVLEYGENTNSVPKTLRLVLLSGDRIPLTLPGRAWNLLPDVKLHSLGGATEASIWSIHFPITEVSSSWPSIPYGKPLANQKFYVLNELMEECPDFVPGDLYIGGKGLADGYFNDPKRTQEAFIKANGERIYKTGDIGCMLPDGNIRFLGRKDFQVKIRGHRIELGEIESKIREIKGIDNAVAIVQVENNGNKHISAFAVPEHDENSEDVIIWNDVTHSAEGATQKWLEDTNIPLLYKFFDQLDEGALMAMREALCQMNAFSSEKWYTTEELLSTLPIPEKHSRLFCRILDILCKHSYLEKQGNMYGNLKYANREMLIQEWDKLDLLQEEFHYGKDLMELLRRGAMHFGGVLTDREDPLQLLFPEGRTDFALAIQFNYTGNRMNNILTSAILTLTRQFSKHSPLRIFEVGAGVGGTSNALIPMLPAEKCKYTYTDLSTFFLNAAQERYKSYPFMEYALFDINKAPEKQGIARGKADVVIACNVLHNAIIAIDMLRNLRGLLAPGGWFIFIETTGDNLSVTTSMEFLNELYHFEDERKKTNSPFLSAQRWAELLTEAGAERVAYFPGEGHPLARACQTVFIARFGGSGIGIQEEHILQYLREHLPEYMIPSHVNMISSLPITNNGKIDRNTLASFITSSTIVAKKTTTPKDTVELELIEIVKKLLSINNIEVEDDFYAAGGDSLLLTQLVAKIRDIFGNELLGWDETLRYAVQHPTIRSLADFIKNKRKEVETEKKIDEVSVEEKFEHNVIPLLLNEGIQDFPHIFLIPDGTATINGFNHLLQILNSEFKISALTPASVDSYLSIPADKLISTLAYRYASFIEKEDIKKVFICGSCMGGLVTLEVLNILESKNKIPDFVAVINSIKPPYIINDSLLVYLTFIQEIGINLSEIGINSVDIGNSVSAIIKNRNDIQEGAVLQNLKQDSSTYATCRIITAMSLDERLARTFELYNQYSGKAGTMSFSRLKGIFNIVEHSIKGVNYYIPKKINSKITLFRRTEEDLFLIPLGQRMNNFWKQYAQGGVNIIDVPGNHWTSMQKPGVENIAQFINKIGYRKTK